MENKPTIICITPMKNEAWILEKFLSCASIWADHIIVLDQHSEDNSVEIARKFEKVKVLHNDQPDFNDYHHWKILLEETRKIHAQRKVIISIDCDEFLSANSFETNEWKFFTENAKEGSLLVCNRVMVSPNFEEYSKEPDFLIGFIDDGVSTIEDLSIKKHIHNIRLPYPINNPDVLYASQIKLLHLNVVDYDRMLSKMRWYQCYERILNEKSTTTILDQYFIESTFEEFWLNRKVGIVNRIWFEGYEKKGIPMSMINKPSKYFYWDEKILNYFHEHGTKKFARLNIWNFNWELFSTGRLNNIQIKRSIHDKIFLRFYLFTKKKKWWGAKILIKALNYFQ